MMRVLSIALLLLGLLGAAQQSFADAYSEGADLPAAEEARYRALLKELRCLVCQNESLADSDAPLATDLRKQVRAMVVKGESDDQIRKYLTDRYGDYVLYRPPFQSNTVLLWVGPAVLVLGGLTALVIFLRGTRARAKAPQVDPEALRKLLEEPRGD